MAELLSMIEQLVLVAVCDLGENAYGVTIRERVRELSGRDLSVGAVYGPLDRLARDGLLRARMGEPTAERGGRAKRFYEISAEGASALAETRKVQDAMARCVPSVPEARMV